MFKDEQFRFEDIFKAVEEDKESIKKAAEKVEAAGKAAKKCLNTDEFAIYREQFAKANDAIINKMMQYTKAFFESEHGDMAKYGANMARFITKLQDLRILLDKVESDAGRQ